MNQPRLHLFAILCVSLAFGACSSSRDGLLRLYQRNHGDIINLAVGETMEVVLDGDPGTEIHWLKKPGDEEILQQLGGTEYKPDLESPRAERKLVTQFRATAPGRTRLRLTYRHPTDTRPIDSTRITPDRAFEVWVVVKEER